MQVTVSINSQNYTLTYNSATGAYEATMNAPQGSSFNLPGGYYPVSVTATDEAGNTASADSNHQTLGESLRLVVKEKVAPVISITSPTDGALNTDGKPNIAFTLRDNTSQTTGFSGVNLSSLVLKVNGNAVPSSAITSNAVTGGYNCSYRPSDILPDGTNTITVDVSDNDGNAASTSTVSFKVDTVAPSLNISNPTQGAIVNDENITVIGTTSDSVSSPVTVKIKVGSVDQGAVTVESDGSFTKTITLSEGTNTIEITATDKAGKSTVVTRTVILKTTVPVIRSVSIIPNPTDAGRTYTISVVVEDEN